METEVEEAEGQPAKLEAVMLTSKSTLLAFWGRFGRLCETTSGEDPNCHRTHKSGKFTIGKLHLIAKTGQHHSYVPLEATSIKSAVCRRQTTAKCP